MSSPTTRSIARLRADLAGRVIEPGDPTYDEARTVFAGGIDRRPAVIVQPVNSDEVARVIALARNSELPLAVRSGGHSAVGHSVCDDGVVIDLRAMKGLDIDPLGRTTWAETGLTARDYTTAVGAHALATGFGDTGSVGIGGITLGGGVGFLARKYGLTIDNLLAADVVTADGSLLRVDAETHPDLFWAIRGGGGNFGVATRFNYRLNDVGTIVGGLLLLPATPDVISSFIAEAAAAPDELTTIANVMPAPPMPFVPEEHHGKLIVMVIVAYAGDPETGERVLAPFRALATPIADLLQQMPYADIFFPDEEGYHPIAAARTMFMSDVDRGVAETILEHLETSDAPMRVAQLRVLGGAVARVPAEATAYAHRSSPIMTNVAALATQPSELAEHTTWTEGFAKALAQGDTGEYVGFVGDEGETGVRAAYPGSTWDRLTQVKREYDPTNLFRLNQNIPPATTAA